MIVLTLCIHSMSDMGRKKSCAFQTFCDAEPGHAWKDFWLWYLVIRLRGRCGASFASSRLFMAGAVIVKKCPQDQILCSHFQVSSSVTRAIWYGRATFLVLSGCWIALVVAQC